METFSPRQLAVIASANKTVYWLFRVTDINHNIFFWSTGTVPSTGNESILHNIIEAPGNYDYNEWERPHDFFILNFSGISLRRGKSESGIHAPNDVSFTIINRENNLNSDNFVGGSVRICLVIGDGNGNELCGAWRFRIKGASPYNQQIDVECEDFLQEYLKGSYPNTQLIDEISPSIYGSAQDTLCVPEPYGTCYIPLRSIYATSDRYYLLGPSTYTYTISEVRSPRSLGTKITWVSGSYSFTQSTITGGWRAFQPMIANNGTSNGVWVSGSKLLDMPTKFSRSDTASVTNPADIIRYVLRNMGVQDYDLNLASFDTAKATFTSWGLAWNFAFFYRQDRTKVLSNLLAMCDSCFILGEQISLQVLSKTSKMTITDSEVIKTQEIGLDTFKYSSTLQDSASDSGYIAYQIAGESQDEFLKASVPAKTTKNVIDDETIVFAGVQNTQHIQKLGTLYYQRKFLKSADVSSIVKGTALALRPDDVITINHVDYGGSYAILIDEITIKDDVSINLKCIKFSVALDDWADLNPGVISVGTDAPTGTYSIVISGTDTTSSTGTPPNVLPGRLKIGDGTSYIVLDPAPPIKVGVYSASVEQLRIGNLSGFVGVATNTYGLGIGAAPPGFRAKITATEAYIGNDTNYMQYTGGVLIIRGTLNASDITVGSLSGSMITSGTVTGTQISGTYVYTGTLTASQVNAVAINASSITTGTLAAARMDAAYVYAGTLTASQVNAVAINASSITTGTLAAARIAAGSLNASVITSGTITGTQISGTYVYAGTLTAGQVNAVAIDASSITVGNLSATRISGGTLNCSLMTVTNLSASNITTGTLTASVIATGSLYGIKIGTGGNGIATDNLITNAATKGAGTYSNSLTNFVGMSWVTVASLTITTVGGSLMVIGYALMYSDSIDNTIELAIYRGASLICLADVHQDAGKSTSVTPCAFDSPAAGTYTYYLKAWRLSSGDGIYNRSLVAVELRR